MLIKRPKDTSIELNFLFIKVNRNIPSSPPYVYDAIFKPRITIAVSLSSKNMAIPIRTSAQAKLINLDNFNELCLPFIQSIIVDEANALIDELRVDIAADRTPVNKIPRRNNGISFII